MEFSSPFFCTRSLACCSLQREAFLSLPFLFSNGWQNVGACNHEIPFLSSYPFTFPCISAVDIAGRADFLPSSVLGLFQFPSIKHAQRQLPLSQTPPWLVMPCSRPNSRGAPGHPSQFLGCTALPGAGSNTCTPALGHRHTRGATLPATAGLAATGYGLVRDAHLCPAKAAMVHHVHAGRVSIS